MNRVTNSPMLRGELDSLNADGALTLPSEFFHYANECWEIFDAKLDRQNQDPLMQQCDDLEDKPSRIFPK
jgi:hypothetical protein